MDKIITSHGNNSGRKQRATWYSTAHIKQCCGELENGVFVLRTVAYFVFTFEPLGGFDPAVAQTKVLAGAIAKIPCSVAVKMSTKRYKMRLGSVLVNRAVFHNFVKIVENVISVPRQ